jgi:hypothetical protein
VAEGASLSIMAAIAPPGFAPYYNLLWRVLNGLYRSYGRASAHAVSYRSRHEKNLWTTTEVNRISDYMPFPSKPEWVR